MDASDQVNAFLLAGVLGAGGFVAEDGAVDLDRLRTAIAGRLDDPTSVEAARLTRRVRAGRHTLTWESCRPDLSRHVRLVEPVVGRQGLADLTATLMTVPLPLDRPLWELVVVPGAASEGPGIILRLHHSVADGVAGIRLMQYLFGESQAEPSPPAAPDAPARNRRPLPERFRAFLVSVMRVSAVFRSTVPPTVLLGPIGPRRSVAFAEVELATLSRVARSGGATVNDALLAAVGEAAATALRAEGQPVPPVLPASVPVALPGRGSSGNAVGVMLVPLDTGEPDAATRLARIAATTRSAKAEARTHGTLELTRTRWGSRLFARLARRQRFVALFVTNVRGPEQPLSVAGAPLRQAWPVAPIQGNVRLGVAAMSYAGRLAVAVHADADALSAPIAARALADELGRIAALR